VIPSGTTLKGLYLSPEGVAFVDLSAEAGRAHVGALDEIFIVYSIVDTLTDNLPAITAVQLLVEGRQVDTLAGHVDVRRPVIKDLRWTELPQGGEPPTAAAVAQGGNPPPR
jgi:spore germination protein GerM